ncbi:MAG TPA: glycosyltransferase family 4 protein [Thermoanaerobaculia bacterium]|nr:glycosyltransferase family 4 protein [Thermoanaerobaculia bacterium]
MARVAIIGPVYPYRAGIAYCTTRLAEEMARDHEVAIISFSRQYPQRFYPGGEDIDPTLRDRSPAGARFILDILNPLSWLKTANQLANERYDALIIVWWIWVWALPYLVIIGRNRGRSRVILQCHNVGEKEPAWWKRALTNRVLRRADVLVVHADSEAEEARRRAPGVAVKKTFLPVHELGGDVPSREEARGVMEIDRQANVALSFGHVRPFKALDIALRAWRDAGGNALLLVAGEAWWNAAGEYVQLARELGVEVVEHPRNFTPRDGGRPAVHFDFRFIPDAEVATWFAASDVVLAPYRSEAQSGVALTAFHFGRPVIASTVGGLPEVIEEGGNGMLVPPDDPAALATAIRAFFGAADRAKMEQAARDSAARYSWEEYGSLFLDLVAQTAGARSPRRA